MTPQEFQIMRNEFINEINEVIDRYPLLGDPPCTSEEGDHHEHYKDFDPHSPKIVEGFVLLVGYQNIEGFGQLFTYHPNTQPYYMTLGLVTKANHGLLQ